MRGVHARARNAITGNGFGLFNANIANTAPCRPAARPRSAAAATGGAAPPGPGNPGCDRVSGADAARPRASSSARRWPPRRRRCACRRAVADAPPTGSFVDPAEGDDVAVGETDHADGRSRSDDFGVKSVALTLDGAPLGDRRRRRRTSSAGRRRSPTSARRTRSRRRSPTRSGQTLTSSAGTSTCRCRPATHAATLDAAELGRGHDPRRLRGDAHVHAYEHRPEPARARHDRAHAATRASRSSPAPNVCTAAVDARDRRELHRSSCASRRSAEGPQTRRAERRLRRRPAPRARSSRRSPATATSCRRAGRSSVGGTVAATLGLTISSTSSSLGTFAPGVAADYTTSVALGVTTSARRRRAHGPGPEPGRDRPPRQRHLALLVAAARARRRRRRSRRSGRARARSLLQSYPAPVDQRPRRGDVQAVDLGDRAAAHGPVREDRRCSRCPRRRRDVRSRLRDAVLRRRALLAGAARRRGARGRGDAVGLPRPGRAGARRPAAGRRGSRRRAHRRRTAAAAWRR